MASREDKWIKDQRNYAEEYLREQKVDHLGIGDAPAFHVHPYLAVWAVQSKHSPGSVGWWVITGDLPADYINSSKARDPRDALRAFARQWQGVASYMLRGEPHSEVTIGSADQWPHALTF